jgi:hypothetical protein
MKHYFILGIALIVLIVSLFTGVVALVLLSGIFVSFYVAVVLSYFLVSGGPVPPPKKQLVQLHYAGSIRIPQTLVEVFELGEDTFELFAAALAMTYHAGHTFDRHTKKSGDRGVDAYLKNIHGLRVIVQAKLWNNPVGQPELRDFWGTLFYHKAVYGFFVTSSSFTPEAKHVIENTHGRIIALDGNDITALLKYRQREVALNFQDVQNVVRQSE